MVRLVSPDQLLSPNKNGGRLKLETDSKTLRTRIDRTRKDSITTLVRAQFSGDDEEIIDIFKGQRGGSVPSKTDIHKNKWFTDPDESPQRKSANVFN